MRTPPNNRLFKAVLLYDPKGLLKQLARRAHPDARQQPLGSTALMWACYRSRAQSIACVGHLLAAGADPNLRDLRGESAAMWAAGCANQRAIELLARAGADLGAQSASLWGVEQSAAQSFDLDFIAWMHSYGYAAAWREAHQLGQATSGATQTNSSRL